MKIIDLMENEQALVDVLKKIEPFLKENKEAILNSDFLYRGIKNPPKQEFFEKTASFTSERKPKDIKNREHKIFDEFLNEKFGFKYRSFAKFTTGCKGTAESFGKGFIFIPFGEYEFCYSTLINDPWNDIFHTSADFLHFLKVFVFKNDIEKLGKSLLKYDLITEDEYEESLEVRGIMRYPTLSNAFKEFTSDPKVLEGYKKFLKEVLFENSKYKTTKSYKEAANVYGEVMVKCESYLMIRANHGNTLEIQNFTKGL